MTLMQCRPLPRPPCPLPRPACPLLRPPCPLPAPPAPYLGPPAPYPAPSAPASVGERQASRPLPAHPLACPLQVRVNMRPAGV